jgi:hypothetical protein
MMKDEKLNDNSRSPLLSKLPDTTDACMLTKNAGGNKELHVQQMTAP